jgi:hypothetical protein
MLDTVRRLPKRVGKGRALTDETEPVEEALMVCAIVAVVVDILYGYRRDNVKCQRT